MNLHLKQLSDSEILGFIAEYDPYYKEDKYKYIRDTNIFDFIQIDSFDKQFVAIFRRVKFEEMFKGNIYDFLNKMVSKIDNIFKFGVNMDLIDIKKYQKLGYFFLNLSRNMNMQ